MKKVEGDIIKLMETGQFHAMIHGCNCFNTMNSGVARLVRKHFPEAYHVDCQTQKGSPDKLGHITVAQVNAPHASQPIHIINAYTQYRYGRDRRHVDYEALRSCFSIIASQFADKRICYPAIGAGLGGGDWKIISQIIDEELEGLDHTLITLGP